MTTLDDDDRREAVAQFRADIIGGLCRRDVPRGALSRAFEKLAEQRFRPPGSETTRSFAPSTLERWYYAYKNDGLEGLKPKARADGGYAQNLSKQMRKLPLTIRREHPSASVPLILRTLVAEGRLSKGAVSASTIRRFHRAKGLTRRAGHEPEDGRQRLSWEAEAPMSLWHGDVLYGQTIHPEEGEAFETRIHGMLDDASRVVVSLEARQTEREIDMLVGLADALRRWGKPDAMYFDNGSTYRGTGLQEVCTRLEIGLIHARPCDPQARGKMERFWRTLRQGCLNHLGRLESLHELNVRLRAFLDQHYHHAAHGGLIGKAPKRSSTNVSKTASPSTKPSFRRRLSSVSSDMSPATGRSTSRETSSRSTSAFCAPGRCRSVGPCCRPTPTPGSSARDDASRCTRSTGRPTPRANGRPPPRKTTRPSRPPRSTSTPPPRR